MAWQLKGKVAQCNRREYGFAKIHVEKIGNGADALFEGLGDELEVRVEDRTTARSYWLTFKLPVNFCRSGCPMEINSQKFLSTSTLLGIPPMPLSQPSPTTANRGTVFNSIPKSPTLHADEKLSESLFLVSAAVRHTGQWSDTKKN